jgi:hypothetical protein
MAPMVFMVSFIFCDLHLNYLRGFNGFYIQGYKLITFPKMSI